METAQFWNAGTVVFQDWKHWRIVRWPEMTVVDEGKGEAIPEPGGHRLVIREEDDRVRIVGNGDMSVKKLPADATPLRAIAWGGSDALLATTGKFALNPPHSLGPSLLPIPPTGCTAQPFGAIPTIGMRLWRLPLNSTTPIALIQSSGVETIGRPMCLPKQRIAFNHYHFGVFGSASMQRVRYWDPSQGQGSSGRDLFPQLSGATAECVVSPDHRRLAFLHIEIEPPFPFWYRLALSKAEPQSPLTYLLPEDVRLSGRAPVWSPDGRFVAVNAFQGIRVGIVVVDVETGTWEWLGPLDGVASQVALAPGGTEAITVWESPSTPPALYRVSATGRIPLFDSLGETRPEEKRGAEFRLVRWQNGDITLEGVLAVPSGDGPHPLVVDLHGGPINWPGFSQQPSLMRWCNAGFAAFAPDYRESGIAGKQAMLAAHRCQDMPRGLSSVYDVLAGADEVVRMGIADADHLYLFGHSAGGHLVNRIVTVDHRFRSAVCWEGHADTRLAFLLTFGGGGNSYFRAMLGGNPWQAPEGYRALSPIVHVADARTPILLLYGDHNGAHSPVAEAIAWYTALREHGVEAELVFYRGEGHLMEREENREDLFSRSVDWFRRH